MPTRPTIQYPARAQTPVPSDAEIAAYAWHAPWREPLRRRRRAQPTFGAGPVFVALDPGAAPDWQTQSVMPLRRRRTSITGVDGPIVFEVAPAAVEFDWFAVAELPTRRRARAQQPGAENAPVFAEVAADWLGQWQFQRARARGRPESAIASPVFVEGAPAPAAAGEYTGFLVDVGRMMNR